MTRFPFTWPKLIEPSIQLKDLDTCRILNYLITKLMFQFPLLIMLSRRKTTDAMCVGNKSQNPADSKKLNY